MHDLLAREQQAYMDFLTQPDAPEQPVVFLTDREAAQVTAVTALGPLALMFDRTPVAAPVVEHAPLILETHPEVAPDVHLELPTTAPERLHGRAALYFAAREYSLN